MSTPQSPSVTVLTVQAHPDDYQSILSGILTGLQVFQAVAPFILQIIAIEKGQPATVTVHQQQQ